MKEILYVFLISILPIVELRGAIPVGAALGLPPLANAAAAILGNLLPVPFILFFIPKILDLLERIRWFAPVVRWVRYKADKHSTKILGSDAPTDAPSEPTESADTAVLADTQNVPDRHTARRRHAAFFGLLLFVLLPFPGTGAWTGSLVASLFNMPKRRSFPAIILGVLGCAIIMSLASYGVVSFLSFLAE